ncbi:MAG: 1-phosphofructokinase family hexose kinase, partial [Ruminococcus sp.]|nr:1-phosphofructokinase family hexose kinase [Candidatus Apopatosoma intestinale]
MKILTLTPNPAFDIHADAEELKLHHENFARVTAKEAGGKGINIARAAFAGGCPVETLVVLGEENGADFSDLLQKDGIPFTPFYIPGRIRENLTVHEENGAETRISFHGFAADASLLNRLTGHLEPALTAGDILVFSGRAPDGLPIPALVAFLTKQKERGVRLVLDSRSLSLNNLKSIHPFLIKPNEEEVSSYLGRTVSTLSEAGDAARELRKTVAENVIVSMGTLGAVLACPDGLFSAPAPTIRPVSTIGAGDSMIAGFLTGIRENASPQACLRLAVAYGSAACLTDGTRPPRKEDIASF